METCMERTSARFSGSLRDVIGGEPRDLLPSLFIIAMALAATPFQLGEGEIKTIDPRLLR